MLSERELAPESEGLAGQLADVEVPRPPIGAEAAPDLDHREAEDTALTEPEVGRRPSSESQGVLAALLRAWQRTESPTTPEPTGQPESTGMGGVIRRGLATSDPVEVETGEGDAGEADSIVMEEIPVPQGRVAFGQGSARTELVEEPGGELRSGADAEPAPESEPAPDLGLAQFTPLSAITTDQLDPQALQSLQAAGIHSLEQLVEMEAQDVRLSGLRYTRVLRLQFLARRTLREKGGL